MLLLFVLMGALSLTYTLLTNLTNPLTLAHHHHYHPRHAAAVHAHPSSPPLIHLLSPTTIISGMLMLFVLTLPHPLFSTFSRPPLSPLPGMLLLFVLMGAFAGFSSARLYKTFKGKQWQRCTLLTATLFPGQSVATHSHALLLLHASL